MDELAASVTAEQGKTLADARGDVFRGLGALHACVGVGRGGRVGEGGKGAMPPKSPLSSTPRCGAR